MCGITGAVDLIGKREFHRKQLLAMTDVIAHRGPDDGGMHLEPGVALGARRLSIIDVSMGHQPIANETGDIWVTFNGELFDYPKLRQKLLENGHQLTTHCDTEAWVHLYEEYGVDMFSHVQGQFAVALWDRKERTLILGRDRVGICPLYYTECDGWLLWGSEIKALLSGGLVSARPDHKGIDYLFNFFCAGTHRTFFEGIKLVPPGHFIKIKNGQVELHQYWDLDFPDAGQERRIDDPRHFVDEFEGLFQKAVKKRLRSDVPVVCYLSGGIDSTMVLNAASHERTNGPIPSFTMGLDKVGPDERSQASETAKLIGSPLTTVTINSSSISDAFPELMMAAEGPVLDTSCAALMLLAKEVHRQGFKVALTGEGADEALAGYLWFKTQKMGNWFGHNMPKMLLKLVQFSVHAHGRTQGGPVSDAAVSGVRPAQQYMYEMVSLARESLYSEQMWAHLHNHNPYTDLCINHNRIKAWHPLNQSLYVGYKVMLPGLLMISKGDRVAMHSSVETRYPFLDEDVIEFCASIDPSYKLHHMTDKWLLRQAAMKTLPHYIAKRHKTSFRTNLSQIFFGPNRPVWVDQLLSPESLQKTGYFNPAAVIHERELQHKLPRYLPRQLIFDAALSCVVSIQLWHHLFFGDSLCDLPHWNGK